MEEESAAPPPPPPPHHHHQMATTTSNGELDLNDSNGGTLEPPLGSPSAAAAATEKPAAGGTKKGVGLRKWRRIKREVVKEGSVEFTAEDSPPRDLAELAQMHKRRIPLPDSSRNAPAGDERDDAEGESSVASVESRNTGLNEVSDYGSPFVPSKSPEVERPLILNGPAVFSIGAVDSDNSDDWGGSKSSTAASAPKAHGVMFGRDRGRHKGVSMFSTSQRITSRSKGESGRTHRLKAEAENSISNSNAVSNGKHSDKSVNFDGGDNSDEGLQGEEVRSGYYYRENGGRENLGHYDESGTIFEEKDVNNGSDDPTLDPLVESVTILQNAQEALETEIEKLTQIENEAMGECEEAELSELSDSNAEIDDLDRKINSLESELEAALTALREKDLQIVELKSRLNQIQMQPELDQLIQEKLEAEINSLVITKTTQKWRRIAEDQYALYNETKSLSSDHKNLTLKLRETEKMEGVLKERVQELLNVSEENTCTIEVLKFRNLTCATSFIFFMELVLLMLVMLKFIMHLLPTPSDIVPT